MTQSKDYRRRIYGDYVRSHEVYRRQLVKTSVVPLPHLLNFVRRFFPTDRRARIVDLGCGSGELLLAAQRLGYTLIEGVDGSRDQVRIACARGLKMVSTADVFEFLTTKEDGSFDCIVAYDFIEHFDRNELFDLCDLIYRKLSVTGIFVIHTPNAEGLFGGRMRYGDLTHELAFTSSSLAQLGRLIGFSDFKSYPHRPSIYNLTSALRYVLWLLVETLARIATGAESGQFRGIFTQNLIGVASKRSILLIDEVV
jgi:2-polyprenyl-3-methyl-5-hydroxy-6-metoxy-1,4-benzoquinol methylase